MLLQCAGQGCSASSAFRAPGHWHSESPSQTYKICHYIDLWIWCIFYVYFSSHFLHFAYSGYFACWSLCNGILCIFLNNFLHMLCILNALWMHIKCIQLHIVCIQWGNCMFCYVEVYVMPVMAYFLHILCMTACRRHINAYFVHIFRIDFSYLCMWLHVIVYTRKTQSGSPVSRPFLFRWHLHGQSNKLAACRTQLGCLAAWWKRLWWKDKEKENFFFITQQWMLQSVPKW